MENFGFLLFLVSIVSVIVLAVLILVSLVKKNGKVKFYLKLIGASIAVMVIGLIIAVSNTDTTASTDTNKNKTEAVQEMTAEEKAAAEKAEAEAKAKAEAEAKEKAEKEAKAKAEAEAKAKAEAEEKAKKLQEKRDNAQPIEYAQLKKNADRYAGEYVKYTGEILEIQEGDGLTMMRLSVTEKSYGYSPNDAILITYPGYTDFVEDDIVTVYGVITGNYSYTSQAGWEITIPSMIADTVE